MTITILDVPFTEYGEEQVLAECIRYVESKNPHVVVTAGPEFVMRLKRNPSLYRLAQRADMITPDGIGIVLAARLRGKQLRDRVTGVALTERLVEVASQRGWRIFLLGASDVSLQGAMDNLRRRYKDLQVEGHSGYFSPQQESEVIEKVKAYAPHIWLVGLGQPRQEELIDLYRDSLSIPLSMGVGGTFDILSGTVKRAPQWVQDMKIEWFYRLVSNPRRLRRQLALPLFAYAAWREGRKLRTHS